MKMAAVFLFVALLAPSLSAHGLVVEWRPAGEAVILSAVYDGGREPAVSADVELLGPGDDRESPFLLGSTDPRGQFAFVPDRRGAWTATVDDGFGHRAEIRFEVDLAAPADGGAVGRTASSRSRVLDLVTGLSILFGLTGLWLWRRAVQDGSG